MCSLHVKKHQLGFTLIEVITVIVILSILAALGGKFVVESTQAYQSTQTRSLLVNKGRQAVERMSRQLRLALPNSVRLTNANSCVEFMPIAGGGSYVGYVADAVNGASPSSSIVVTPHTLDFGTAAYVSIGAMASSEVYGSSPASRATLSNRTGVLLTLSGAKTWLRNSVASRFYLLGNPQAFCVVGSALRFYPDQNANSSDVDLASSNQLISDGVSASSPFSLTAGSENRNVNVNFNLSFAAKGETLLFNNSVMIRNVP